MQRCVSSARFFRTYHWALPLYSECQWLIFLLIIFYWIKPQRQACSCNTCKTLFLSVMRSRVLCVPMFNFITVQATQNRFIYFVLYTNLDLKFLIYKVRLPIKLTNITIKSSTTLVNQNIVTFNIGPTCIYSKKKKNVLPILKVKCETTINTKRKINSRDQVISCLEWGLYIFVLVSVIHF